MSRRVATTAREREFWRVARRVFDLNVAGRLVEAADHNARAHELLAQAKRARETWARAGERPRKALATRQPWASLIACGRKTIEVRSWQTHYRGPLIIVASGTPNREGIRKHPAYSDAPRSCLVALVDLVDVRPMRTKDASAACMRRRDCDPWLFSWVLANPRPLVPTHYARSRISTWNLEPDVRVKLARQQKGSGR
jgi:hypothetical protein